MGQFGSNYVVSVKKFWNSNLRGKITYFFGGEGDEKIRKGLSAG
jgi:hypothetical protein